MFLLKEFCEKIAAFLPDLLEFFEKSTSFYVQVHIKKIKKEKHGFLSDYDPERIVNGILKAATAVGGLWNKIDWLIPVTWKWKFYILFPEKLREKLIAIEIANIVTTVISYNPSYASAHNPPKLKEINTILVGVLNDYGLGSIANHYAIYNRGRILVQLGTITEKEFIGGCKPINQIKKTVSLYQDNNIGTVKKLCQAVKDGRFSELVEASDVYYKHQLEVVTQRFASLYKQDSDVIWLVWVAGPSSSGKTTTTNLFVDGLSKVGISTLQKEVDGYFPPAKEHPHTTFGDINFELPEHLNIQRLINNIIDLLQGKDVYPPYYDFKMQQSLTKEKPIHLFDKRVLVLDCLHGLEISHILENFIDRQRSKGIKIPKIKMFRIGLEALSPYTVLFGHHLSHTHIRMLRRCNRDVRNRSYNPLHTIAHWGLVRKGDFMGILPYFGTTDVLLETGLMIDLPVLAWGLKTHDLYDLSDSRINILKDEKRYVEYNRALKVRGIVEQMTIPTDEEIKNIPQNHLIQEFISKEKDEE